MSGATISTNVKMADGTLVSVGGVGFDDFYANLLALMGEAQDADDVIAQMRQAVTPTAAGSRPAPGANQYATNLPPVVDTQQAAANLTAGGVVAPTCQHGVKVRRSGGGGDTGKKAWAAWMCPSEKGTPDQCPAEWIR